MGDALKGAIAVCSRGSISFFQKGNYAVQAGAIATIIYNNTAGTINMDLTDYQYTQPCVSVTQEDGALMKANAVPVTNEAGKVLYSDGRGEGRLSDSAEGVQYHEQLLLLGRSRLSGAEA